MYRISLLVLIIIGLGISGCSSKPEEILTEKEYYDKARDAIDSNNFLEATTALEALETYHPFGRYAEQAQLDLIYARYNALDTDGAAAAAERFIKLHPESPHVDYAYYIKGLSAYYADMGLAVRFLPIDPSSRDIGQAREAFQAFSSLISLYPDSKYAPDAEQRMVAIRNTLAAYELHVARYYIRREALVAALNRARHVVEQFPETPSVPDALAMSVELYRLLGMPTQASDTLAVLAANYPDHSSFDDQMHFVGGLVQSESRSLTQIFDIGLTD